MVGSYRVGRLLGRGGMGEVYEARHVGLDKRVALKTLTAALCSDEIATTRFVREGRSAAAIQHENVVAIHDVGAHEGRVYLAMEYLEGEALSARFARGKLLADELVAIVLPVLDAIDAAHRKNIVHRDLKPENIFLTKTSRGEQRPVVLDFGISKVLDDANSMQLTDTSAFVGTPYYVSPEQARGARHVTPKSDQYALGVVLYEGLCGSNPFAGCDSLFELVAKVQAADYAKPSQLADLPPTLEAIVLRAMHVDPDRRYADLRALGRALLPFAPSASRNTYDSVFASDTDDAASRDEPTHASQTPAFAATLASGDHKLNTTLGNAAAEIDAPVFPVARPVSPLLWIVGTFVAAGLAAALLLGDSADDAQRAANVAAKAPLDRPDLGEHILAAYRAGKGHTTSESSWLAASEDFGAKSAQLNAPAHWRAAELFSAAQAQLRLGEIDDAIQNLGKAIDHDPKWAPPHAALASAYSRRGAHDEALAEARKAQQLEPSWAWAIAAGAGALSEAGRFDEAVTELRRALVLEPKNAELLSMLALQYHHSHNDGEARRYAEEALAADEDAVSAHVLLAEVALEHHETSRALLHASRAVAVSPTNVSARLARGDALQRSGEADLARDEYAKVVELSTRNPAHGAPSQRVEAIKQALARGQLPAARDADPDTADTAASGGRHPGRSVSPARSEPARTARDPTATREPVRPARSRTPPRSKPSGGSANSSLDGL